MKILSYQDTPAFGDIDANLETMNRVCKTASSFGVDVAVFPELFMTGYNISDRIKDLAIHPDGDHVLHVCNIAKSSRVAIVTGLPEIRDGKIYNSAIAVNSDGVIVGHHDKVHLFGDKEREVYRPGSEFQTFEMAGRRCGIAICYDIEFPEVSRELKRQGADVIFVPTANMIPYFDVPITIARSRALENGIAVIYSNLSGHEGEQTYTGLSAIIGPDGKDIARAGSDAAILIADMSASFQRNKSHPLSTQIKDLAIQNCNTVSR